MFVHSSMLYCRECGIIRGRDSAFSVNRERVHDEVIHGENSDPSLEMGIGWEYSDHIHKQ